MADIDLDAALARAQAAAKSKKRDLTTTRGVPAEAENVNRFVMAERAANRAAGIEAGTERELGPLDLAYNALPMTAMFGADPRMRAAAGESMFMGATSPAMAGIDTLIGYLTGDGKSFGENLEQRQAEGRARKAYAPYTSTAVEMGTAVPVGNLAAKGAQTALSQVLPRFATSPVGAAAVQGLTGAAEGAGYSAATGEGDPLTAALIGGGVGGVLGGALPLTGEAAQDAAKREATERMFGPLNAVTGRGAERPIDIIDVIARRQELGPQATIMDLDPAFRGTARGAVTPSTIEAAGPLFTAAGSRPRPVDDILMDDLDAAIGPSYGKVARQEDRAAIIGGARQKYDEALTEMRDEGFEVDHEALRDTIESAFTRQGVTTSSFAAARDRMLNELDGITGYRPPKYNKKGELVDEGDPGRPLTVDEALALKKEFDFLISERDPSKSVPREVRAVIIDTKNALNDELKSNPKFSEAAKIYADEFDVQNAEKFASEVFKGNYSADDFAKLYGKMSDLEKQAVARAARDEIQVKFIEKPGGAERFSRRVGPTQDAAFTQKLDTIFGTKAVDKLYEAAMRARSFGGTAKTLDEISAAAMEKSAQGVGGARQLGNLADILTVAQQAAQGRATSGATAGAVRRLFLEGKKASNEAVQREMLGYLGQQGQSADEALMEMMSYLYGTKPPRIGMGTGAGIGGALATGFAAGEGPQ
jgi:hypothetical protein